MKKEKGISLILVVIIVVLAVLIASAIIFRILFFQDKNSKDNNTEQMNTIVQEEEKPDYTSLDEGIATETLPKIELDTIAERNSTIDGRTPSFYNPVIPQGFKAITSKQDATIDEEAIWGNQNSYLSGLVIEDENGNQFVWVPVENMDIFKTTDWSKNAAQETLDDTYIEPEEDEEEEYYQMYYKVKKYGGFYIGRFEVGDAIASGERATVNNSDSIVIKKYVNAYNYVPYTSTILDSREITGANELAEKFGKTNKYNTVVTSVVYGVQWDSVLRFIASDTNNVNNSTRWGNYVSSEINYINPERNPAIKRTGEIRLIETGSSEDTKAKNIYDLAGNLYEWTKETTTEPGTRVVRGGCYVASIAQLAASRYTYGEGTANNAIGFRISFYVK